MSSKIFKQLISSNCSDTKKIKKEESLSKDKNLSSSRKKVVSNYLNCKRYKRNNYLLNHISSFNLKTSNSSKKKKIILNSKKTINKEIYNSNKNIFNKKIVISKKEIQMMMNNNMRTNININSSKQVNNISIKSVRSESEEKNNYEEKYNNKLSYELILPTNKKIKNKNPSNSNKKYKINRNIITPVNEEISSMTYNNNNFSINKSIINNIHDNIHEKQLIKVNLNTNKRVKRTIKKETSYAISSSNTNSNTNSRSIANFFNDNKVYLDINNFNKDIKEIINIKESIAILKEQLKGDNIINDFNLTYLNKAKNEKNNRKKKTNRSKQKQQCLIIRNENKNNCLSLETSKSLQKVQVKNKISDIKLDNINRNKTKIYINPNSKDKSNLGQNLRCSKDSKHSSLSKKKIFRKKCSKTCKNFFSQRKNINNNLKLNNNSSKNIQNMTKSNNGISTQKSHKGINNVNISHIYKNRNDNDIDKKNDSIFSVKNNNYIENKIERLNKNHYLMKTDNLEKGNNTYHNKNIKKVVKEIIKNNNNKYISNSINNSKSNISFLKKFNLNKRKTKLKFKFYKKENNYSFDLKSYNINNINNKLLSYKSQIVLPLYKNKKSNKNENEIRKKIEKMEIISKAGENIFGQIKTNQDNYFCNDLINDYKIIGVCDGHGDHGHKVSEFIKNYLPKELNKQLLKINSFYNILKNFEENINDKNIDLVFKKIKDIFYKSCINTNKKLLSKNNTNSFNLKLSGSTCISVLINQKNFNKIYISNIGDSRAIIIKEMKHNFWTCQQLSRDHKPIEKDESSRIYKSGGEIQKLEDEQGGWIGPLRVWVKKGEGPGLAMTRSFGDVLGSTVGVICVPEVSEYIIKKEDKAIIIASDGLWEFISNKETTNIVKKAFNKKEPNRIVNQLYKESYKKWKNKDKQVDDITIICIILNNV